ncbi:MAG: hypothetical protein LUE87_00020 [Lachnospiraceae bacterium]|nr:hypothetical protein [Lachnospiraceae bacterium]
MCRVDKQEELIKNRNLESAGIQTQTLQEKTADLTQTESSGVQVQEQNQNINPSQKLVRQREENARLAAQAVQEMEIVHAGEAADGAPVQEQTAAKKSIKARMRDSSRAKEASRFCPVGTAATYDMVHGMKEHAAARENSINDHDALISESTAETKVLRAFCVGYKVDKKGRPASKKDAAGKEADDRFFEDYCSDNLERRKPHLDRIVDEMLSLRLSREMFTETSMRKHDGEQRDMLNKMVYLENVIRDPVNAPYFERMAPAKRETLDLKREEFNRFHDAVTMTWNSYGVDFNSADYYGFNQTGAIRTGRDCCQELQGAFDRFQEEIPARREQINAHQEERVYRASHDYALKYRQKLGAFNRVKEDERLGLRAGEEDSVFFRGSMTLMEPGEEHTQRNLDTVRTMLEVGRLGETQRASEELYQRTRDIAAPRLKRVLACDVDVLAGLTDEALLCRCAELDELSMDNMFLADVTKLKHPSARIANDGSVPCLKDELVGSDTVEYSYKMSMLRGLSDRARGLAIRRYLSSGGESEGLLTDNEMLKYNGSAMDCAVDLISKGERVMEAARKQRKERLTRGTEACEQIVAANIMQEHRVNAIRAVDNPLIRSVEEIRNPATPEMEQIKQRLMDSQYYSLEYSEQDLINKGILPDIGEALFRSFGGFCNTEAAQAILSPEQMKQMAMNLGAGAGLHKGEWEEVKETLTESKRIVERTMKPGNTEEELAPAVTRNKEGMGQYKEVIRAQYDMIARKYGEKIAQMSDADAILHQDELVSDFGNSQVESRLVTRYPDFIDPQDESDLLLKARIGYYALMGKAVTDRYAFIASGGSEEAMRAHMGGVMNDPQVAESLAYLKEHDPAFHHATDWSQKVRAFGPQNNPGAA